MRRSVWIVMLLVLVLALTACGGKDKKSDSVAETPTNVPFSPSPLPPTWTPSPEGFRASLTPSPTPEEAVTGATGDSDSSGQLTGGQQFPPTWTPGKPPSRTPMPTNAPVNSTGSTNLITGTAAPTWTPQPQECYALKALVDDVRIYAGQPATITWNPIPGFSNYVIEVRHPGGGIIHSAIVSGTSYTIPGDVFTQANAYGWEVSAIDGSEGRVCFPISGEIVVSFPE